MPILLGKSTKISWSIGKQPNVYWGLWNLLQSNLFLL